MRHAQKTQPLVSCSRAKSFGWSTGVVLLLLAGGCGTSSSDPGAKGSPGGANGSSSGENSDGGSGACCSGSGGGSSGSGGSGATGACGDAGSPTAGSDYAFPAYATTMWNPGLNSVGGIPARTTICATLSSTGGDDTNAIQAALDNCHKVNPKGGVVVLNAGTFNVTNSVNVPAYTTLRGSGANATTVAHSGKGTFTVLTIDNSAQDFTGITNLTADAKKDAYSVTLASDPGLKVGEIIMIDQVDDPTITVWGDEDDGPGDFRGDYMRGSPEYEAVGRPTGQVMEVASIAGNTVTFSTPFHMAYLVANTAQLSRFSDTKNGSVIPAVEYAGIESLHVTGGNAGDNGANIQMNGAAYSWVANVESDQSDGSSISFGWGVGAFRCVLRDSYIHTTVNPSPGGGGYGIALNWHSSDNLVENNISWNFNKVMVMRATGGGNVIGYNYMEDGWINYDPEWQEVGLNASHMTTPHTELFEGNEGFNFDGDSTWGNAVYISVLRNHFNGQRAAHTPLNTYSINEGGDGTEYYEDAQNARAIGLMHGHYWYTFVGNVLGSAGQTIPKFKWSQATPLSGFIYDCNCASTDALPMWYLGYNPVTWNSVDAKTVSTTIRDGNFDFTTNTVHWDNAEAKVPNSLYLCSTPGFFGTNPWPWVDGTNAANPLPGTLPAKARFVAGTPNGS